MEAPNGDGTSLHDIQNYLASFNKEISDGTTPVILTQAQAAQLYEAAQEQDPALASPDIGAGGDHAENVKLEESLAQNPVLSIAPTTNSVDNPDTAVQVLASVAANSIPQANLNDQLMVVPNRPAVNIEPTADLSPEKLPDANQTGGSQGNSVILNSGNSYQTVTIVPSEVNQGGEVSYVLIVSQPEGKERDENMDMSVYDFKEEPKPFDDMDEEEEDVDGTPKRIVRASPKKTPQNVGATQLMCNYCNYTSPKRYLLTRHMKTHSEERPHKCNICDRGFKTIPSLQNHINTHTGVRPHKCKECDAAFTTSGELVRHVRYRHTFEKPHKCPDCNYASVELSKLKRHVRSHTGERPYQCPHCSYASPDTYKLKRHLRIHTGEKPYECDVCHARFTQSNSLKAHKLIHTGNKPVYQCELCPTTCGRKTDLKIHVQKLHTSDRPLQCKKCGKSFPDRYTYKIHMKTHEGEKCFKCELCPYAALSQRHLENHILTHTGEKPHQCDECEQSFRQKQLLKRHKNLYHTPDYIPPAPREKGHECGECHKQFAHRGNLLRHMALHDPDHPEYHIVKQEEEEEAFALAQTGDEPEELDPDEDSLDEDDEDEELMENPPQKRGRGANQVIISQDQPQLVQVVSLEGADATEILLQMEEGEDGTQIITATTADEAEEAPVKTDSQRRASPRAKQVQVQVEEDDEIEDENEELPEVATPVTSRRGRGRPRKVQVKEEEENLVEAELSPTRQTRGQKRKVAESPVAASPRKGRRTETPKKGEDEIVGKKPNQKQKDIEECFGFGVDD